MSDLAPHKSTLVVMVHNGRETVRDTLQAICEQDEPRQFSAIVICNGCSDDSPQICLAYREKMTANAISYSVCVIEKAGRAHALNCISGQLAGHLICVDQDAILSPNCVSRTIAALDDGAEFAAPELRLAAQELWTVQQYYTFWKDIPYVRNSPSTIGVYAISSAIWPRLLPVPLLHSDDKFMRLATHTEKRRIVKGTQYQVNAPRSLLEMIRARQRYMRGNRELKQFLATRTHFDVPRWKGLIHYSLRPERLLSATIFFAICLIAWIVPPKAMKRHH